MPITTKLITEDLTSLRPASELASVAADAEKIQELNAVAHQCNCAANTGATELTWSMPLFPETIAELEANGYELKQLPGPIANKMYIISWKA